MRNPGGMAVFAAVFFVVSVIQAPVLARADISTDAKSFVEQLAGDVIDQLTDPSVSASEQERRFRGLVDEYIAFKSIARWVLGRRAWRAATESQRERYFDLFADLMAATYARRFQQYAGESLAVTKVRKIDENQALVSSAVKRPGAEKAFVLDWRVRRTGETIKVIDIMVEGLSMAQTQRSEFKSFLRQNRGDVGVLLTELEIRIAAARNDENGEAKQSAQNP